MASKYRVADLYFALESQILRCIFKAATVILSSFWIRLLLALSLLPIYAFVKLVPLLPAAITRSLMLPWKRGRSSLISASDSYRSLEKERAVAQMHGDFKFTVEQLVPRREARGSIDSLGWSPHREAFELEGVQVSVVHEQPSKGQARSGKKILFLHGNPSWSFMWRNVIEDLLDDGHEVFALDWIGHGASDKPISGPLISFELHMQTLITCIERFKLSGCYIAAHDWGGTGILGGHLPEAMVMRYMCPEVTRDIVAGYCAPYTAGIHCKASVGRFAHIVPGIPDFLLKLRGCTAWRILEGLLGPENFTNINAQAFLTDRNIVVRQWWASEDRQRKAVIPRVSVAFGQDDPLLKNFKRLLDKTFRLSYGGHYTNGTWIANAGHYPVEEKPETVAKLLQKFVEKDKVEGEIILMQTLTL